MFGGRQRQSVGQQDGAPPPHRSLLQLTETAAITAHQLRPLSNRQPMQKTRRAADLSHHNTLGVQRVDTPPPGARPGDNGLGKSNSHYVCPRTYTYTLLPSNCPGLSANPPTLTPASPPFPFPVPSFRGPSVSPVLLALVINRQMRQAGRGPTGPQRTERHSTQHMLPKY